MSDLVTMLSTELVTSTNPSIWICNFEVIPHISIKARRWLKGYILAVLEHQNETEQIVTNFDALQQGWPTLGTHATTGTRMLSKWHAELKLKKYHS